MKSYEFKGAIEGWPGRRGENVGDAIINTLNEYEGDNDAVQLKVFIVPRRNSNEKKFDDFVAVNVQWIEEEEAWQVLRYR